MSSHPHPMFLFSTQRVSVPGEEGIQREHRTTKFQGRPSWVDGGFEIKECLGENDLLKSLDSGPLPTQTLPKHGSLSNQDSEQDTVKLMLVCSEHMKEHLSGEYLSTKETPQHILNS